MDKLCTMCHSPVTDIGDDTHSHIVEDGVLWHWDMVCGYEGEEVNYCPMCGRKVRDEGVE